jgi:hypothetical protein
MGQKPLAEEKTPQYRVMAFNTTDPLPVRVFFKTIKEASEHAQVKYNTFYQHVGFGKDYLCSRGKNKGFVYKLIESETS